MNEERPVRQRLDRWLWQARFFKSRSIAARMIIEDGVRLNGTHVSKPAQTVGPGDVLTFAQGDRIRTVEVVALAQRRGPAAEAQTTYVDHAQAPSPRVGPRPTGRERRDMDAARAMAGAASSGAGDPSRPVEPGEAED